MSDTFASLSAVVRGPHALGESPARPQHACRRLPTTEVDDGEGSGCPSRASRRAADRRPGGPRWAWAVLLARLGALTVDDDLCRATCAVLLPVRDQMAVVGNFLPVGPVGWFVAEPLALLGLKDEAREASHLAEAVSRRLGARSWTVRCRLQRRRLLGADDGHDPTVDVEPPRRGDDGPEPLRRPADVPVVEDAGHRLSPRQRQILDLAARGLTNAEIARTMYLSIATVERHCTIMYRSLGVRNRAQALAVVGIPGLRPC